VFQIPSAQVYYSKAIASNETLSKYTWKNMRSKIHYLKTKYEAAVLWLRENCGDAGGDIATQHGSYI